MKSNNCKFILFVLIAIIAVPALSSIAPQVFALTSPPDSDSVTINGQTVLTLTASDQREGAPVSVGNIQSGNPPAPKTVIALTEQGGAISDLLIYDPIVPNDPTTGKFCPLIDGQSQNLCFISDDDKQSLDNEFANLIGKDFTPYIIPETGGPQDVSDLLGAPANSGTVVVQSDVEPNTAIPEFPIPFSMVIIFVAVAAVYMGIRQKMPGFKSF